MPNPPTPNLGLIKPIVGGDLNAWGDSLNANLDKLDAAVTLASLPTVASAAARDLLFPTPSANQIARRADTGFEERFDKPTGTWLPEGITRTAGPVVSAFSKKAKADGIHDDRQALIDMDNAIPGVGRGELDPGTYLVGADLTLNNHISFARGAKLKPAAGVKITLLGPIQWCMWQIFDKSGGGTISLDGNPYIKEISPRWFGATGGGVTDQVAELNWMSNCIPDGMQIVWDKQLRIAIAGPWITLGRSDLTYKCEGFPAEAYFSQNKPTLKWIGPAGGTMVCNYNSGFISYIGIFFDMQTAWVWVDQDQLTIETDAGSDVIKSIASNTGGAAGPSFLDQLPAGMPISISFGGVGATQLNTTLAASISGTQRHIAVNASTSFQNNGFSLGQSAPNPQARISTQCIYFRNKALGGTGVWQMNGLQISRTSNANCEFNFIFENYVTANAQFPEIFPIPQNGNSFGSGLFNGNLTFTVAAPGGTIAAGTNTFGGFTVDTFSAQMNGARIWIGMTGPAQIGPNMLPGPTAGFMKFVDARNCLVYQDRALTIPLNALHSWPPAAYNAGTTYQQGDVVMSAGTLYQYIATAGSSGNAPPNAGFWAVYIMAPYDGAKTYNDMDYVTAGGKFYQHFNFGNPTTGTDTTNPAIWHEVSTHFHVGGSIGTGVWIGPSFNAHKQVVKRNQFNFLSIGFRSDGGSFECENNFMTNNDIDHVILNNQAIASTIKGDSSENSRQWATIRTLEPLNISSSRFGAGDIGPSVGFIEIQTSSSGPLEFHHDHDEGAPPIDAALWNYSSGAGNISEWAGCIHAHANSLQQLGLALLPQNTFVEVRRNNCSLAPGLLPYEHTFSSEATWRFGGLPKRIRLGLNVFGTAYPVVDADLAYPNSWGWGVVDDNSGVGFRDRPTQRYRKDLTTAGKQFRTVISGAIYVNAVGGASYSPDLMAGDLIVITMNGAFNLDAYVANSFLDGAPTEFMFINNTGAPITPTAHPIYHWENDVLPTIPAGKRWTCRFRMVQAVMIEVSRNQLRVS